MSKKEYDAREMAQAILKKAEQIIKDNKSFSSLTKTDPQNMNSAQAQGLKGIKLPSAPKAPEKTEMKPIAPPAPQAAAKMPKPLKAFMGKREMKKSDKSVADKAIAGAKTPEHDAKAFDLPKKTVSDLIKEKEAAKKAKV